MGRRALAVALAVSFGVGLGIGCVDVGWVEGIRCADESCPAGFVCCSGQCYKSCGIPAGDGGAAGGAPNAVDAGNTPADASTGGAGGVGEMRPPGGTGTGAGFGSGPRNRY